MLIDLLQASPGQLHHPVGSVDRLITGNYKSNGNLVSLKVDIIDFTEFQRHGCLVSPGGGGGAASCPPTHSHSITGTLFCQPDTNTVRLNITVLGPCSPLLPPPTSNMNSAAAAASTRHLWDDALTLSIQQELSQKDVKPWIMTSNKMANGAMDTKQEGLQQHHHHQLQYSPFTSPVSPPCSREGPPPLLDFHSDQLMSEIQSMSFDGYGCGGGGLSLNSQLFGGDSSATVAASSILHSPTSNIGISRSSLAATSALLASQAGQTSNTNNNNNNRAITTTTTTTMGELKVSSLALSTAAAAAVEHLLVQPSQTSNNTLVKSLYTAVPSLTEAKSAATTAQQPPPPPPPPPFLLLQPKIERSDSICSEYSSPALRDDFLSYSADIAADLDDLEADSYGDSPPMSIGVPSASYPLVFPPHMTISGGLTVSPLGKTNLGGSSNIFFSKSFINNSSQNSGKLGDNIIGGSPLMTQHDVVEAAAATSAIANAAAWSPSSSSSSSSLVFPEAVTPPATAAIMTTTIAKSPMMIPLSSSSTMTTTTGSSSGCFGSAGGMLINNSNSSSSNSSPKTPSSFHGMASPRSVGSAHEAAGQQQQQLMLGSPLHGSSNSSSLHPLNTSGASPKQRNRRNSSFDETKPHVCPQCGARFTTKSNLGQHAKIHLAVKPFICEICSHGFTRAAHYESHVAKHKGLKTHRCEQCGESFARLDNLLRHSARHKHGKIFDCGSCGKGFHRKDKLLEHEKVHSEYKFPCSKCSKTFHTNDALKHHLPLHEDNSKTQCTICLKFITIKSLSKHMAAFHKDLLKSTSSSSSSNENNNSSSFHRSFSSPAASSSSTKSKGGKAGSGEEKTHPCRYCKKAFVSAAKLRLHVAKCHAEERHKIESMNITLTHNSLEENIQRNYFDHQDFQLRVVRASEPRFPSPSGDSLPSQQVPEMDLPYAHSSPEDHHHHHHSGSGGTDLNSSSSSSSSGGGGSSRETATRKEQLLLAAAPRRLTQEEADEEEENGGLMGGFSIPTIHIPEFPESGPNTGGGRGGGLCSAEISNEAIHALFFN